MAVILDFQVNENEVADGRRYDPAAADPAVIETTYFMMPVRFSIGDRDLLQRPRSAWLTQPGLGFATHLSQSLDTLRSAGTAICSLAGAGTLHLQRHGERIQLTSSFSGVEADAPVDELDSVVKLFLRRVEDALRTLAPELTKHPSWPTWFPAR